MKTNVSNTQMKYYLFLNRLRESGATNMFGAAPFLEKKFRMPEKLARKTLLEWMAWVTENPSRRDI